MNYSKIRKTLTFALQIAAIALIAAIFILTCLPIHVPYEEAAVAIAREPAVATEAPVVEPVATPATKLIALTFDDGPTPTVTNKVLDSLEKYHARATFFVVGRQVKQARSLVKRAVNLGCEIGNHTWDHKSMAQYKGDKLVTSLQKTVDVVKKYADYDVTLARPTYGVINAKVKDKVSFPLVSWNVDTDDWKSKSVKQIMKKIKGNKVSDGDIILMHDLHPLTAKAIAKMIPYLQKKGYELVTVSELMQRRGIDMKKGVVYYSAD